MQIKVKSNFLIFTLFLLLNFVSAAVAAETIDKVKIGVFNNGIYSISGDDLANLNVDLNVSAATISLRNNGITVPVSIENLINGTFNSQSRIVFFGEKISKDNDNFKYTEKNRYILDMNGDAPTLFPTRKVETKSSSFKQITSFKDTIHAEENTHYDANLELAEGKDRWYWDERIPAGQEKEFTLNIPNVDLEKDSCSFRVRLQGVTGDSFIENDHHTVLYVNNEIVGHYQWDGRGDLIIDEQDVSPCPLISEESTGRKNILRINATKTAALVDTVYLDWFEIDYWKKFIAFQDQLRFKINIEEPSWLDISGFTGNQIQLYDLTDAADGDVVKLTNIFIKGNTLEFAEVQTGEREYFAVAQPGIYFPSELKPYTTSNLKSDDLEADYIIITPKMFLKSLSPFISHRESFSDLKITTVDVADIYNEFGYGHESPKAIKEFLRYVYNNWSTKPKFVLLVGDGSSDPKGQMGNSFTGLIPAYMFNTTDPAENGMSDREATSDSWYVTFNDNSVIPDIMLGRFPVKNIAELRVIISKIITYETGSSTGWNRSMIFVADDDFNERFSGLADTLSDILPADYLSKKVYLNESKAELKESLQVDKLSNSEDLRAGDMANEKLIEILNEGSLVTTYIGHGAVVRLADEGIFYSNDTEMLTNRSKLTFLTGFNCLTGYFISPLDGTKKPHSIAEAFLLERSGGSIASWMPTWVGRRTDHQHIAKGLFTAIFENGTTVIGEAIIEAITYASNPDFRVPADTLNIYMLFGDPALRLKTKLNDSGIGGGGRFNGIAISMDAFDDDSLIDYMVSLGILGIDVERLNIVHFSDSISDTTDLEKLLTGFSFSTIEIEKIVDIYTNSFLDPEPEDPIATPTSSGGGGCFISTTNYDFDFLNGISQAGRMVLRFFLSSLLIFGCIAYSKYILNRQLK